jgi:hypothetical protein
MCEKSQTRKGSSPSAAAKPLTVGTHLAQTRRQRLSRLEKARLARAQANEGRKTR